MLFIKSYWKVITWAVFVFMASAMSGDSIPKIKSFEIPYFDKLVHFGFYFVFSVLAIYSIFFYRHNKVNYEREKTSQKRSDPVILSNSDKSGFPLYRNQIAVYILACIVAVSYGAMLEVLQYSVFTNRTGDMADFIANTIGAVFAVPFYLIFMKRIEWILSKI